MLRFITAFFRAIAAFFRSIFSTREKTEGQAKTGSAAGPLPGRKTGAGEVNNPIPAEVTDSVSSTDPVSPPVGMEFTVSPLAGANANPAEPVFIRQGSSSVYLLSYDGTTTVPTCAYFTSSGAASPLSLTNSWSSGTGVYLFLGAAVTDNTVFAGQVQTYLSQNSSVRFLWITNPNVPANLWQLSQVNVNGTTTLGVNPFAFGSYTLTIGGSCAITLQNDGTSYYFLFSSPGSQTYFYFQAQNGAYNYPLAGTTVQLSFAAATTGAWQFGLNVGGSGNAGFDTLDAGLRYYTDDPAYAGYLRSFQYPVFLNPSTAFVLNGNLDPVNQLVPTKTFFRFPSAGSVSLATNYRTNLGQAVTLSSTAGAGFVFAAVPQTKNDTVYFVYTLVPQGAFGIGLPAGTPAGPSTDPVSRLMLGSSGVEYAGFLAAQGNQMIFYPGNPAYAPAFQGITQTVSSSPAVSDGGLSGIATTSWIFIAPGSGNSVNYYAQPDSAVLFEVANSGTLADYLGYLETLAGTFVTNPVSTSLTRGDGGPATTGYPAVPYAGIAAAAAADCQLLEKQVLSTERRKNISPLLQPPAVSTSGDVYGVTPQGLKIGLDQTKTYWKSLSMAHTGANSAAGQAEQELQFTDITGAFKTALQSNQLFVVAANPNVFLGCASANFQLTRQAMAELQANGVPAAALCNVRKNPSMEGKLYADITAFDADLLQQLGQTDFDNYKAIFHRFASKTAMVLSEEEYYELSSEDVTALNSCGTGWTIPTSVTSLLTPVTGVKYPTRDAYTAAVTAAIGATNWTAYGYVLLEYGRVVTGGWDFNLSPYFWNWSCTAMQLTSGALAAMQASGVPSTVTAKVEQAPTMVGVVFPDKPSYDATLLLKLGQADFDTYHAQFNLYASGAWSNADAGGTMPSITGTKAPHPTFFIYKYAGKSLLDLASDTSTWSWPEVSATGIMTQKQSQQMLLTVLNDAIAAAAAGEHSFDNFAGIIQDPDWNGILVLNSYMALDALPPELQGLAAGIDPANFYGHHLGINVTPVHNESGVLKLKDSALFGLVYYNDPVDQYNEGDPYAFKVLNLKVLLRNSVISDFASQVELMINELFGEVSNMRNPEHGNNLILNGTYQLHDGHASYIFVQAQANTYEITSQVLDNMDVLQAQFVTIVPPDGIEPGATVKTQFILNGRLRFQEMSNFDCFSFGNTYDEEGKQLTDGFLNFSNLLVHMDFPQETPDQKTFLFDAGQMNFDLSLSLARPESFYSHFPLTMAGLLQQKGTQTPGDLGYMSVVSPLNQGSLKLHWYGFSYTLDLGSLGSLAGDVGFFIELFIGWQPVRDSSNYNVYIGVKLPGSSSGNLKIPIEGILNLVFKKIEITASYVAPDPAAGVNGGTSYILKFRGISLSFFSITFPPGLIDAYVFGNPGSKRSALGWYAAYAKEDKKDENKNENENAKPKMIS